MIVPIAGIIITFVLCYELISMITEKNNLHDMDTWMFFKCSQAAVGDLPRYQYL